MLLRVHDVHVTTRHVEVPEACPSCGVRIGPALEMILEDGATFGHLSQGDPDEPPENALMEFTASPGVPRGADEQGTYFVTGYRCGTCRAVLAQGEFSESEE